MSLFSTPTYPDDQFTHIVPNINVRQYFVLFTLTIAIFLTAHPYAGIWHDSILYTAQALNLLYPQIYQGDVFFKYGSQASYTIFPLLHSLLIEQTGVDNSAFLLTIIGLVTFFTGIISLARYFLSPGQTILFLIVFTTFPTYENPVLYIFEVFATSRNISVGLSLLFLVSVLNKKSISAAVFLIVALLLHPLIPLGIVAIALLLQRPKFALAFISLGVAIFIIGFALSIPPFSYLSLTIDDGWRELVVERAPYLFIEHWFSEDLGLLVLEICLILSARAYCTDKLRSVFNALLIATAVCLAITLAGSWLSNALLMQLQLWRILLFVHIFSSLALAWLISATWHKDNGKLLVLLYCTTLLSLEAIGGLPAVAIHIFWLWSIKKNPTLPPILIKSAYLLLAQGVFWYVLNTNLTDPSTVSYSPELDLFINIGYCLRGSPFYITAALGALLLFSNYSKQAFSIITSLAIMIIVPVTIMFFDQRFRNATWDNGNTEPYVSLRKEIPEAATVYIENGLQTCWFTLRRQHYMSPYQSAGVVFSRDTALETKRRADLLFHAGFEDGAFTRHLKNNIKITPPDPSLKAFNSLCQDPDLDYIFTTKSTTLKAPDKVINEHGIRLNIYYCSPLAIEHSSQQKVLSRNKSN